MQNKWYVVGVSAAATLCALGTIRGVMGEMPLLALIPGALCVGLIIVAVRTARADSFGPVVKPKWDKIRPPAVSDWLKHREDHPRTSSPIKPPQVASPPQRS